MWHQTLIVCSLLSILVAGAIVVRPFFQEKPRAYFDPSPNDSDFSQSLASLEALSDLETDYKMGKISEQDFESMSQEHKREYLDLINSPAAAQKR